MTVTAARPTTTWTGKEQARKSTGARVNKNSELGAAKLKFAFFPGCMIQVRYPQMEAAVRKTVAPKLGIELVDLPGPRLLPGSGLLQVAAQAGLAGAGRAQPGHRRAGGLDFVTICSGCTETLCEAAHLLNEKGGELLDQVNERLARVGLEYHGNGQRAHTCSPCCATTSARRPSRATVTRPLTGIGRGALRLPPAQAAGES